MHCYNTQSPCRTARCLPVVAILAAFALALVVASGASVAGAPDVEIGTTSLRRTVRFTGGRIAESRFSIGNRTITVADEGFGLQIWQGGLLTGADFPSPQIEHRGGELVLSFRHENPKITVTLHFTCDPRIQVLRKWADVDSEVIVDRFEVERLHTKAPTDLGGFGQPLYLDSHWFTGLEYPGATNECVDGLIRLYHFPGRKQFTSKVAVWGGGDGRIEDVFAAYRDRIRVPPRPFNQYNSWYDLRGSELNVKQLAERFMEFKQKLLDPYGVKLDAFVPDDGWQNRDSIWQVNRSFLPDGFAPLARILEANGSRLGLWMPFNGTNLNVAWGVAHGLEAATDHYYCIAAPNYNKAIRAAIAERIRDGDLIYFKHDFNSLYCTKEGHGHLPTRVHGFEAALDAELDLLDYERKLQPGIFLNVTSNAWLSPWWLMHADTIWMAASDFGFNKEYPQLSPREWAMSYRDEHFYHQFHDQRLQFPLSALMTHGIIKGQRNRLGGDKETAEEWSDCSMLYFGRGVLLRELYLTPSLLNDDQWEVVGRGIRWANANWRTLMDTHRIGGEPAHGDAYGYAHWSADRAIFALRNPALRPCKFTFDTTTRPTTLPPMRALTLRIVYPWVERTDSVLTPGGKVTIDLPAAAVVIVEAAPPDKASDLQRGERYECERTSGSEKTKDGFLVAAYGSGDDHRPTVSATQVDESSDSLRLRTQIAIPAGIDYGRMQLVLTVRGGGTVAKLSKASVNGAVVNTHAARTSLRSASGDDWSMVSIDLRNAVGSQTIDASWHVDTAILPTTGRTLSAVLLVEEPLPLLWTRRYQTLPTEWMERPRSYHAGQKRYVVDILDNRPVTTGVAAYAPVTTAELRDARNAQLSLEVFDVNGEQYANKPLLLNDVSLGNLPENSPPISHWERKTINLSPAAIQALQIHSRLVLNNRPGDAFKVRNFVLGVQLRDGRWVRTQVDDHVYSSAASWLYTEGVVQQGATWRPIELPFKEAR